MPRPSIIPIAEPALIRRAPASWKPRPSMGARIDRDAARARGWERDPAQVGRPGKGLVPFEATDPRVEPEVCTHTQIRDLDGAPGPVSRCLDCGGLIHTARRALLDEPDLLDDEALDALRQEWNGCHWGE